MERIAIFVSIFAGILVAFAASFISVILAGSKAAQDKARARRLVDARMNARLLRFNI